MHRPMDEPVTRAGEAAAHPWPLPDPARVDPEVLGALLARHGWHRRGGGAGPYSRWAPPGGTTSLLLPRTTAFCDSEDLLGEALTALARTATPAAREILIALTVPSDEIRWWREVPEPAAGAAGWLDAERLHGAARQILLAGALAARGRAGHHGARHRRRALAALGPVGSLRQRRRGGRQPRTDRGARRPRPGLGGSRDSTGLGARRRYP